MQKEALKSFVPPEGALKKNDFKFSWELSLYDFLWGWPIIFMSKRGPEIFDV